MPDLGNKTNPFLAGIAGLGEGLLQGFLIRRKMDEEQRQFNEKIAMQERQNSLLMEFRRKDFEQQQLYQDAQIRNIEADNARLDKKPQGFINSYEAGYTKVDPATGEPVFVPFSNVPQKAVEYIRQDIAEGDVVKTYQIPKGSEITPDMKPIAISSKYKPEIDKEPKDFTLPALVGEINGIFQMLKSMSGDENDPEKAPIKANLMAKTEALMEASGLTSDTGHIWDIVQNGGDLEKAINIAALARGKSFTLKQREYLRLYFKTRYIPTKK